MTDSKPPHPDNSEWGGLTSCTPLAVVKRQKAPTDPSVETVKGSHIPVAAWPVT